MECRAFIESLSALLDGELSAVEASKVQQHLLQCPACHDEYRSLSYSWELVDAVLLEGMEAPNWGTIENQLVPAGARSQNRYIQWLPAAAVLGLTILSGSTILSTVGQEAHFERQLTSFVAERDRRNIENQQIAGLEPAGWVSHNPFEPAHAHAVGNPFLE